MSNFTPLVKKEYEFQGDKVYISFRRLSRRHMMETAPKIAKLPKIETIEELAELTDDQKDTLNDFLNDVIDVIPEYTEKFEGLYDSEKNPIGIQVVVDDFYFMHLATLISMDMVRESSPKLQEGNS